MNRLPNRVAFLLSIGLTTLLLVVLSACSSEPPPPPPTVVPTAAPPTPTPLPRGGNLTIRLAEDVPDLRPWQPRSRGEEQITELLYNGLVYLDDQLRPVPDLAESWASSPNGEVITFTLRPELSWHDGQELTGNDVAFTLRALREVTPTTALLDDLRQRITQVTVPNSRTVIIQLNERYAPIFSQLTLPILPKHLLEGTSLSTFNAWDTPIGSGAFRFAERVAGQTITLNANPTFHRGAPLLDRVAFVVAPDPAVAQAAIADGRLLLAELPWNTWRPIEQAIPGIRTGVYPENGYYFLGFNLREGRPFADLRVRQALAAAIDLPTLVENVTEGQGLPISNSAVPRSWADQTPPPTSQRDPERAAALLDEAGWQLTEGSDVRQREGVPLAATLFVNGADSRRVQAAELIALSARTVGISITVQPADLETVIKSKYAPPYDFDLLLGSWSNGSGDPGFADYRYYDPSDFALFHSSQINGGPADSRATLNIVGFRDSAYDNQVAAAQQLYDLNARAASLKLAQERVASQLPYLFLWADQFGVAARGNLTSLDGPINFDTPNYLEQIERWYLQP